MCYLGIILWICSVGLVSLLLFLSWKSYSHPWRCERADHRQTYFLMSLFLFSHFYSLLLFVAWFRRVPAIFRQARKLIFGVILWVSISRGFEVRDFRLTDLILIFLYRLCLLSASQYVFLRAECICAHSSGTGWPESFWVAFHPDTFSFSFSF